MAWPRLSAARRAPENGTEPAARRTLRLRDRSHLRAHGGRLLQAARKASPKAKADRVREGASAVTRLESMLALIPPPPIAMRNAFEQGIRRASSGPFLPTAPLAVLCHYTSMKGLRGILGQQAFRHTDHHDLDDKGELGAAEERVRAVLANLAQSATADRDILATFYKYYAERPVRSHLTAYLSCFTSDRDKLRHWTAFAKAGGACLVLKALDELPPATYEGQNLGRGMFEVVYEEAVWEHRLRTGFTAVLSEYERWHSDADLWGFAEEARTQLIVDLALVAAHAGLSSKTPQYREEVEWRWVAIPYAPGRLAHVKEEDGKGSCP